LLVRATGWSGAEWTFAAEPSGRLIAHYRNSYRFPSVSLSHSGGWVACAISDAGCIGIDIEAHSPRRTFIGIADAAFGPGEQSQVAADGAAGFYRIWTWKEAMAKASGVGIAEVTDRTDRVARQPKNGSWRTKVGETLWWFAYATPVTGLSLAVALELSSNLASGSERLKHRFRLSKQGMAGCAAAQFVQPC
jgi:4'-phosphopantetheinyl transferase